MGTHPSKLPYTTERLNAIRASRPYQGSRVLKKSATFVREDIPNWGGKIKKRNEAHQHGNLHWGRLNGDNPDAPAKQKEAPKDPP